MKTFSLKFLELNKVYSYGGTKSELLDTIENCKDFIIEAIDDDRYKISSKKSVGTLMINDLPDIVDGINVVMTVTNGINHQVASFSSKLRVEHFLIFSLYTTFLIIGIIKKIAAIEYFALLAMWLVTHLFFQMVYRSQENFMVESIVDELGLVELNS